MQQQFPRTLTHPMLSYFVSVIFTAETRTNFCGIVRTALPQFSFSVFLNEDTRVRILQTCFATLPSITIPFEIAVEPEHILCKGSSSLPLRCFFKHRLCCNFKLFVVTSDAFRGSLDLRRTPSKTTLFSNASERLRDLQRINQSRILIS